MAFMRSYVEAVSRPKSKSKVHLLRYYIWGNFFCFLLSQKLYDEILPKVSYVQNCIQRAFKRFQDGQEQIKGSGSSKYSLPSEISVRFDVFGWIVMLGLKNGNLN